MCCVMTSRRSSLLFFTSRFSRISSSKEQGGGVWSFFFFFLLFLFFFHFLPCFLWVLFFSLSLSSYELVQCVISIRVNVSIAGSLYCFLFVVCIGSKI
jgi:hypothetical protein